jgi:predicted nucleic acid-binding protein
MTSAVIAEVSRMTVPDMPDRIIAGTAMYLELPLISRDRKIQLSQIDTIW